MASNSRLSDKHLSNTNIYKDELNNPLSGLNDTILISEIYYKNEDEIFESLFREKSKHNITEVNGVKISNILVKLNEEKRRGLSLSVDASLNDLEKSFTINDFKAMRRRIRNAITQKQQIIFDKYYQPNKINKLKAENLNRTEFLEALSDMSFYSDYETELVKLFDKMDINHQEYINWGDVSSYFITRFREKEFIDTLRPIPFNNSLRVKYSKHNKLAVTVKILSIENPFRIINISRNGSIGLWSKSLRYLNSFQIGYEHRELSTAKQEVKSNVYITDAVLLNENNRVCCSTSKHDLKFFTISAESLIHDFNIIGLVSVPTCMDYCYDVAKNRSYVIFGDAKGNINILKFLQPNKSLYNEAYKPIRDFSKKTSENFDINLNNFGYHQVFIKYTRLEAVHKDTVNRVKFNLANETIISSSSDLEKPLVIFDIHGVKNEYVFDTQRTCTCFDFDMSLNMIVAASLNSPISVWNIFQPSKPISKLVGHKYSVVDVKIHPGIKYLYSLSMDSNLKVWDLNDGKCLQSFVLKFPSMFRAELQDFGPYPLSLFIDKKENKGGMLIGCSNYIGYMAIGEIVKLASEIPLTHNSSIGAMAYSPLFKIVITCSNDSTIIFWNILNGQKILEIPHAHRNEEITYACLDESEKRLYTGARDGTIKAWNIGLGQRIQTFTPIDNSEITGLIFNDKKREMISVGWSKKIVTYANIEFDPMIPNNPKLFWRGETQHKDDILCMDCYLQKSLIATGSYDGEINIWTMETQRLFLCLRKSEPNNDPIDKLLFLKNKKTKLSSSILISSESGYLYFWSLTSNEKNHIISKFYSSAFKDQSTLALDSNKNDSILISGDTKGFVYLWDLKEINSTDTNSKLFEKPSCIKAWRCHDSAIISLKIIHNLENLFNTELICTTSTDWCCRLWTMSGAYIGTFGQESKWNIGSTDSFQSLVNLRENVASLPNSERNNEEQDSKLSQSLINQENKTDKEEFEYLAFKKKKEKILRSLSITDDLREFDFLFNEMQKTTLNEEAINHTSQTENYFNKLKIKKAYNGINSICKQDNIYINQLGYINKTLPSEPHLTPYVCLPLSEHEMKPHPEYFKLPKLLKQ